MTNEKKQKGKEGRPFPTLTPKDKNYFTFFMNHFNDSTKYELYTCALWNCYDQTHGDHKVLRSLWNNWDNNEKDCVHSMEDAIKEITDGAKQPENCMPPYFFHSLLFLIQLLVNFNEQKEEECLQIIREIKAGYHFSEN